LHNEVVYTLNMFSLLYDGDNCNESTLQKHMLIQNYLELAVLALSDTKCSTARRTAAAASN